MEKLGDRWALAYVKWYLGIGVAALALFTLWMIIQETQLPSLVSRENITAIVTEVKPSSNNAKYSRAYVKLQLPDNQKVEKFIYNKPYPAVGHSMPLILEVYDNDTKNYSVNYDKWKIDYQLKYRESLESNNKL